MKLKHLRICGFQCFGNEPQKIELDNLSFLIGPNGSGKTAVLQALCRLFGFDPASRQVLKSDFHVPENSAEVGDERELWIEAEFDLPELLHDDADTTAVPPCFSHMRLDAGKDTARVRFRLTAELDIDGTVSSDLFHVLEVDESGEPINPKPVNRSDRQSIQVHYLPARRDPAAHITFGTNALLGRLLRAVDWASEQAAVADLAEKISENLQSNVGVETLSSSIREAWSGLHSGNFFTNPAVTFNGSDIDSLLRMMSVSFSPGHGENLVDFSRLSDGQKSMLYLSLVLASQKVGADVLSGANQNFDVEKLKPATFTLVAVEEPENSLSPHYLGRIVSNLHTLSESENAQALVATHAPAMLRRADPSAIRYLRLGSGRTTIVRNIQMPPVDHDAYKFVREAVQAFPELYFARLVVLGEGDSEEIILPRLLKAKGLPIDENAISVVPLGGRHVNHFWRLLHGLEIPFVTLLDLDAGRYQGGWGRFKHVLDKIKELAPPDLQKSVSTWQNPTAWNDPTNFVQQDEANGDKSWASLLEQRGIFFSSPLDLDFSMITAFPAAYGIDPASLGVADGTDYKNVLGKAGVAPHQYTPDEQKLFSEYHKLFKLGSKPAAHLNALASLEDSQLLANMPSSFNRLIDDVCSKLQDLAE